MKPVLNSFDVRTKFAIVLSLSSIAVFIQNVYILFFIIIVSVILSVLFYGNFVKTISSTKRLWYVFFAIVIMQSIFSRSGAVIFSVKGFTLLTAGGLIKGAEFILRISIIIFSATIVLSSNYREIVQGLIQLKIPYEVAFMVSVGIRFLPLLRNEFKDVITAIQLRGVDFKKIPVKKRIRVYSYVFTPVVAGVVKKARDLSMAMETRAFRAFPNRTSYLILIMTARDHIVIVFSFLFAAAVFISYYAFDFPGRIV